ncbi:hypothetical protein [Azospirillum agricola]|uniref:hypothetical protein n=1 Tax=Azospirillum agricola TaxID=1720247 RepID=UPI000A0F12FF|nr:hypothetical protein [Azospirillum agricola]SMH39330.1 hypothetical protein SAMN02982994_1459 [Azospirillum lipoferum]
MAGRSENRPRFPDLLEPVLTALDGDEVGLDRAINAVAEALADCETLMVDGLGRPAQGMSDEQAVLNALDTYVRVLLHSGEVEGAAAVGDLMERIDRFSRRRKRRGFRTA